MISGSQSRRSASHEQSDADARGGHPLTGLHEDGTQPTFMDVAHRVYAFLCITGDDKKLKWPGTDECPRDESYRAWRDSFSNATVGGFFRGVSSEESETADRPNVYDIAMFWLSQDSMEQTKEPLPWIAPDDSIEESLVAFAAEQGIPSEQVDSEVYAMLCNLRTVEDVVRSPLLLKSAKKAMLTSYAKARASGYMRVFLTQGTTNAVIKPSPEEAATPFGSLKLPWGSTMTQMGLNSSAMRNQFYQFAISPTGTCSFMGMKEADVPAAVNDEMTAVVEAVNAMLVSKAEKAEQAAADAAIRQATHEARQTELNRAESEAQRARRAAASARKMRQDRPYTASGPHKTPTSKSKNRATEPEGEVARARRAAEAEEGRTAQAAHEKALKEKEMLRVQHLEEQLNHRRTANAIQHGD